MSDRETREFTTPGGHKVGLRTYLTGREANELKAVLFADLKLSVEDMQSGKIGVENIPASFLVRQEQKAVELLIVSLDNSAENAAERALDLPEPDYKAIIAEINAIRNPTTPAR